MPINWTDTARIDTANIRSVYRWHFFTRLVSWLCLYDGARGPMKKHLFHRKSYCFNDCLSGFKPCGVSGRTFSHVQKVNATSRSSAKRRGYFDRNIFTLCYHLCAQFYLWFRLTKCFFSSQRFNSAQFSNVNVPRSYEWAEFYWPGLNYMHCESKNKILYSCP